MDIVLNETTWMGERTGMMDFGWGNGYVLIPKGHKLHGVGYCTIEEKLWELDFCVHGGVTFGKEIDQVQVDLFDDLSEKDLGKWMVGFDTVHLGDTLADWPKESVLKEAMKFKEALEKL